MSGAEPKAERAGCADVGTPGGDVLSGRLRPVSPANDIRVDVMMIGGLGDEADRLIDCPAHGVQYRATGIDPFLGGQGQPERPTPSKSNLSIV